MESIQQQIAALIYKVDSVYQIVRNLDESNVTPPTRGKERDSTAAFGATCYDLEKSLDWTNSLHHDILIDTNGEEISHQNPPQEYEIAPQIQIQRLTAQLTAAYNRIAALEEQLLAKRWQ
jgi:hypothetical protein